MIYFIIAEPLAKQSTSTLAFVYTGDVAIKIALDGLLVPGPWVCTAWPALSSCMMSKA